MNLLIFFSFFFFYFIRDFLQASDNLKELERSQKIGRNWARAFSDFRAARARVKVVVSIPTSPVNFRICGKKVPQFHIIKRVESMPSNSIR